MIETWSNNNKEKNKDLIDRVKMAIKDLEWIYDCKIGEIGDYKALGDKYHNIDENRESNTIATYFSNANCIGYKMPFFEAGKDVFIFEDKVKKIIFRYSLDPKLVYRVNLGDCIEATTCHEFAHALIIKYSLDTNNEIMELFKNKEKYLEVLGDYAMKNIEEFIATNYEWVLVNKKYRPKIVNKVISICDKVCLKNKK